MNVLVIVPTYNERENLPQVARRVLEHAGVRMLVVDDGSPDGTGQIADSLGREFPGRLDVLHRTGPRGLGRSYVDGFRYALAQPDVDLICQMDADLSHDPGYLPDLAAAAASSDVAIGSRYLHGINVVNWPLHRIVLSTFANRYIRTVTGLKLRDITGGYRCWRREALARLPLDRILSEGYSFMVETIFEAARAGCRMVEVPIVFVERRHGQSKLNFRILAESLLMPWRLRLRAKRR
jgi:dolichol-phosphate mannosyltransferase